MKAITVRHNKYYTSVLINEITRENMLEALRVARSLTDEHTVVKPTKKAWERYREESHEEELMRNTKTGDTFEIMGAQFTVIEQRPECRVNGNIILSYKKRMTDPYGKRVEIEEIVGVFYEQSLLEEVYQQVTNGALMFFQFG